MSSPFTITTATPAVQLDASRHGVATFTVTNTMAHPIRGRADLSAETPGVEAWLAVEGSRERDFAVQGTEQYAVRVRVPTNAAPGRYAFGLSMVGVDDPDELFSEGPRVEFEVMQPVKPRRPFPWWIVAAVVGVLAIAAIVTYVLLTRKVEVPDVINQRAYDARKTLEDAGLEVGKTTTAPDAAATPGYVIATTPGAGEKVERGSSVTLVLAEAPPPPPASLSMTVDSAPSELVAGEEAVIRIRVENNAEREAPEAVVIWTMPDCGPEVSDSSVDSRDECDVDYDAEQITCRLGALAPGDTKIAQINFSCTQAGSTSHSFQATANGFESVEEGNTLAVKYRLTVNTLPKEAGGVVPPISGGGTYEQGDRVNLAATGTECGEGVRERYVFKEWDGPVPDSDRDSKTISITMDSNKELTARFESQICTYTLTIKILPADAELLGGSDMVDGAGSYSAETLAVAEVTSETRCDKEYSYYYVFSDWTGVDSKDGTRAEVKMNGDREIAAVYERQACPQYTLTVRVDPKQAGGLVDPGPGVHTYHKGEEITVGARLVGCVSQRALRFRKWSADFPSSLRDGQSVVVVVMDRDREVTAWYFEQGTFCIPSFPTRAVEP